MPQASCNVEFLVSQRSRCRGLVRMCCSLRYSAATEEPTVKVVADHKGQASTGPFIGEVALAQATRPV